MFREGDRLVIEPVRKGGLTALLESWGEEGEAFPEIEDLPPVDPEKIF